MGLSDMFGDMEVNPWAAVLSIAGGIISLIVIGKNNPVGGFYRIATFIFTTIACYVAVTFIGNRG